MRHALIGILIVIVVGISAAALYAFKSSIPPAQVVVAPEEAESLRIAYQCGGGLSTKGRAALATALAPKLRQLTAEATIDSDQIGAIIRKIENNEVGARIYGLYTHCIEALTMSYLQARGIRVEYKEVKSSNEIIPNPSSTSKSNRPDTGGVATERKNIIYGNDQTSEPSRPIVRDERPIVNITNYSTSRECSPIVVSAQSSVTVSGCGIGAEAAKRLQESIKRAIAQNNLTLAQINVLVSILNGLSLQNSVTDEKLNRIINDLESPSRSKPNSTNSGTDAIREMLDRTVQRVGDLKITLTKIESSASSISVYFDMVNEGIVELRKINVFGGGSLGNGGSSLLLGGQEVAATGVEFAGREGRGIIRTDIIPKIHYSGRVVFSGVYGNSENIDIFRLALSQNNGRPSDHATFILK